MTRRLILAAAVVLGALASGCARSKPTPPPAAPGTVGQGGFPDWALALYGSLPQTVESSLNPVTDAKVALGRMLYFESALSRTKTLSCNSCHPLASWGTTSSRTVSDTCRAGRRDIPTVYNAAAEVDLFWDGRAHTPEEQAKGSILSPIEMGLPDEATALARLRDSPKYGPAFRAAFPSVQDPMTLDNMAQALGAFERRLVTPSRWDEFLRGKRDALSAEEKTGFATFVSSGCSDCHNGVAVGGRMYGVLGEAKPWPLRADSGRSSVTGKAADFMLFKVPSLRNVEKTAPYFDYGMVTDLPEAVRLMARYQRSLTLSETDVSAIVTWLKTLTGTVPAQYTSPPPQRTAQYRRAERRGESSCSLGPE